MCILKKNSNACKSILILLVYFFISGLQFAIANTLLNPHDENICTSHENSNKNDTKCISHCVLEINSDCNSEKFFGFTKNHKSTFLSKRKLENLNFLSIEPKSNSPPFFLI